MNGGLLQGRTEDVRLLPRRQIKTRMLGERRSDTFQGSYTASVKNESTTRLMSRSEHTDQQLSGLEGKSERSALHLFVIKPDVGRGAHTRD